MSKTRRSLKELKSKALRLSKSLGGKTPSRDELSKVMKRSEYIYYGYTDTDFQKYCGLTPNKSGLEKKVSDEQLLLGLLNTCIVEEIIPNQLKLKMWAREGKIPTHTMQRRFDGMTGIHKSLLSYVIEQNLVHKVSKLEGWTIDIETMIKNQSNDFNSSRDEECFVYLMRDLRNKSHKIGISKHPTTREKTLQSEQPLTELITSKKYINRKIASAIEKALHDVYSHKRRRGEWFNLNEDDVHELKVTLNG